MANGPHLAEVGRVPELLWMAKGQKARLEMTRHLLNQEMAKGPHLLEVRRVPGLLRIATVMAEDPETRMETTRPKDRQAERAANLVVATAPEIREAVTMSRTGSARSLGTVERLPLKRSLPVSITSLIRKSTAFMAIGGFVSANVRATTTSRDCGKFTSHFLVLSSTANEGY